MFVLCCFLIECFILLGPQELLPGRLEALAAFQLSVVLRAVR